MTASHYPQSLSSAAEQGDALHVAALLATGLDPNDPLALDEQGNTPLHLAALRRHAPVVELLLAHGANPNVANRFKRRPLTMAVLYKSAEIEQKLLDAGAEIIYQDTNGETLLHLLIDTTREERIPWDRVETLIKAGLSPSIKNDHDLLPGWNHEENVQQKLHELVRLFQQAELEKSVAPGQPRPTPRI